MSIYRWDFVVLESVDDVVELEFVVDIGFFYFDIGGFVDVGRYVV